MWFILTCFIIRFFFFREEKKSYTNTYTTYEPYVPYKHRDTYKKSSDNITRVNTYHTYSKRYDKEYFDYWAYARTHTKEQCWEYYDK